MAYAAATPGVPQNFDAPFRFNADGTVASVDQGSPADVGAQLYNVVTCQQGSAPFDPAFGVPWPLFQTMPLDLKALVAAAQRLVPGATVSAVQEALTRVTHPQQATVDITATVPVTQA